MRISTEAKKLIQIELEGTQGVPVTRQSYLALLTLIKGGGLDKYWTESEALRCVGGAQQLSMKLASAIGGANIALRTPVVAVRAKERGMVVSTADGEPHECDDVVLAVPPSVWPKMHFYPELPEGLKPQMGLALKYLAAVKEAYWTKKTYSPSGYTDLEVSTTWDATDKQGAGQAGLCAFAGGPAAEQARKVSPADRDKRYGLILEALLPGYAENFVKGRFIDWPSDPWALCGYSFPGPGEVTGMGPVLHEPYGQMHFAGEYNTIKFVGYMEGALQSGARVARHIAQRDGVV
jgi:monoamine oxidase